MARPRDREQICWRAVEDLTAAERAEWYRPNTSSVRTLPRRPGQLAGSPLAGVVHFPEPDALRLRGPRLAGRRAGPAGGHAAAGRHRPGAGGLRAGRPTCSAPIGRAVLFHGRPGQPDRGGRPGRPGRISRASGCDGLDRPGRGQPDRRGQGHPAAGHSSRAGWPTTT